MVTMATNIYLYVHMFVRAHTHIPNIRHARILNIKSVLPLMSLILIPSLCFLPTADDT